MKKHLLFYLVFLLLATNAWAQTNTVVTVGTATTAASGNGPIGMSATAPTAIYSRHIAIYPATAINATPITQRVLTKIAWFKEDTVRFVAPGGSLKISVKQTTATAAGTFSGANWTNEINGAREVLNISNPKITTGSGWKEFTLATPFVWDGTSNLEIFVDWTGVNPVTNTHTWRYSAGQANGAANFVGTSQTTSIPVFSLLPNIQLTFNSYTNDAGISAINAPVSPAAVNVSTPVTATIKNFGDNAITAATIGWKVNGVTQPDYAWTGNLATSQTDGPKTLGNFTFPMGSHILKAYVKTVNGGPDPLKVNDTAIVNLIACSPLAGTNYTLNKNAPATATNFTSFTTLAQILNSCGVSGPVTVTVASNSGPYTENFNLVNIQGTSATNTITIEGNGNTITASNNGAVVLLDRANYVKINNLVITQTHSASTQCYGIQLFGPSDFVTISNSTVNMPMIFGSNFIGVLGGTTISASGNHCNNLLFQNNTINGGQYGMRINGLTGTPTPTGASNNRIINNQFKDFYNWGFYFGNNNGTIVEGNDFSRPTRTDASGYSALAIAPGSVNCVVSKNRFHNTHDLTTNKATTIIGVQVDATPAAGLENTVKNNVFYNLNNEAIISVFNITGSGVNIYHNTVSIENPARPASNTSNIRALNIGSAGNNVKFFNNIVTINTPGTGTKAAIWLASATTSFTTNNNVLHIAAGQTNAFIGYLTSGKATLTDWRATNTTTPYDMNSVAFNPAYVGLATGNLKPTSPDVNNIGVPVTPVVSDDITGATRNATTPDPGAYEFDLGSLDAGITALVSPTSPTAPGVSTPVSVTLKNFGTASLTSATIGWKVDGVMQPVFNWTGNLASNTNGPVTLGNFTFPAGNHSVCAWTTSPNNGLDINKANDSTCTVISACLPMAGNYTINKNAPTAATNFDSFAAAAERLHNCGVSAKVTISVVPGTGPYTEQVDLLSIPGVSATNRVIFQGNANTLTAIPNTQKTTVLKLDDADYVKINNLNITVGGTGAANGPIVSALQLVNHSDNDTISNCTITMPYTTSPSAYFLGIFAGTPGGGINPDFDLQGNNTSNSVFLNNTIKGGLYGIKINGNAGGTNAVNNKIIGNTVEDCNAYGIALFNTEGNLVEGNQISRPTLITPSTFYAIRLDGTTKNNRISKNRISKPYGGSTTSSSNLNAFGIYSSGTGATIGSENIVSNNVIDDRSTPGSSYGLFNAGNNGIYYYYNTVYTSNPGVTYGFYQVTSAGNIKVINNSFSINSTGSASKYALYFSTAGSVIQSNNNNMHIGSVVSGFTGYWNADFATLANWKTANSNAYDQNSIAADPVFQDLTTGNFAPQNAAVNNAGQPVAAVTTDILGNTRSTTTPDPGAYEFTPIQNDAGVIAIVSPVSGCGLTNQETVTVTIKNFGNATLTSIPVMFQVDGGSFVNETYTGSLVANTTVNYTFTGKANLSVQGAHTILAKTNLTGDAVTTNDATSVTLTNQTQVNLPKLYDFETATSGITALRTVTKSHSTITENTAASFGTGSAKGLILDGIDNANWVPQTGTASPWAAAVNPDNFAGAYICLSTAGGAASDSLWLTFDLKQLYKGGNANTNFRVTVNGTQVGPTFRPPFSGTPIVWQKVKMDLTAYKNLPTIQVGLESSVKEAFANGTGTANLLDNVKFQRRIINGVKEDAMLNHVKVFPNPSNGQFNVSLPQGKTYDLVVTDLVGKTVLKATGKGETQLILEGVSKGTYLLKISSENGASFRKLIVE